MGGVYSIRELIRGTDSQYISDLSDSSEEESDTNLEEQSVDSPGLEPATPARSAPPANMTLDAALRTNVSLPKANEVLNKDKVLDIENSLDTEEIVSLVFLLFEDIPYALQELHSLLNGSPDKKILYNWASIQEVRQTNWKNQFVEALCVIKNYESLRKLGFRKEPTIDHFLPHNGAASIHLNKIKKAAYLICENLDSAKTKTLLDYVETQFPEENTLFNKYNADYLELCFMNWEVTKKIKLSDVKKILKAMEEEHLCNIIEEVLLSTNDSDRSGMNLLKEKTPFTISDYPERPSISSASDDYNSVSIRDAFFKQNLPSTSNSNTNRPNTSTTSVDNHMQQDYEKYNPFMDFQLPVASVTKNMSDDKNETCYYVNPNNPGLVLIINQENFYTEIDPQYKELLPPDTTDKLESRLGTEKDRDNLEKIFRKYGFKVIVVNDLTHIEMVEKIREVVKLVTDESSLFICILSHGDKGIVYGSNSCRVKVNRIQDIMYKFNKANLTDKPKVLILQSCQGQQCQKIEEEVEELTDDDDLSLTTDGASAPFRDMLTFWATIPGYAAIRNKRTGSWFIQALCKKMEEIGNRHHFADICTRIAQEVTSQVWTSETEKKAMTPFVQTTLLKDFYLPELKDKS
ncbi:death related ced-3/Nedd2-like caspase isoform X2 [Leptinotarsa decemlineata]|uniref:death related ced-3/Nedd2-like caspase isoform X2 n=1 Tax=Leptinotarsa decemlineata TaxID=7539 RepID=UPI003D306AAC